MRFLIVFIISSWAPFFCLAESQKEFDARLNYRPKLSLSEAARLAEKALEEKKMGPGIFVRNVSLIKQTNDDNSFEVYYRADYLGIVGYNINSVIVNGVDRYIKIDENGKVEFMEIPWSRAATPEERKTH